MIGRVLLVLFGVAAIVNVAGELAGDGGAEDVTKPLLVPLLLGHLILGADRRDRLVALTAVGLFCCWLGDLALMGGDSWFLVGLAAFLAGQLAYCVGFASTWSANPIRTRRLLAAPYVAWVALLVAVLAPDLGGLIAPVAVYGVVLCVMAALALGVHRLTATGAVVFVASDSLLAVTSLSDALRFVADDALVMATYSVGQLLIVLGVVAVRRRGPDVGHDSGRSRTRVESPDRG